MNAFAKIEVPPVEGAIRNPGNPHHFMVLKPVKGIVSIFLGEDLLARTTNALRLIEIGKTVYDPTLYIPAKDVVISLGEIEKNSQCPLKGQASYYEYEGEEIAWAYTEPYDFADGLKDHFSFWTSKVWIEEGE